jgi:Ca2+-binding RTX toxin-like protein
MTTFRGTRFADSLLGAAADDQLYGLGGNDMLAGYGGADLLAGGAGDDRLAGYALGIADSEADSLYGGAGGDYIEAGAGDTADGGEGDDLIRVNGQSPASLDGGAGYDTLRLQGDISGSEVSGFERLEAALLRSEMRLTVSQLDSFAVVGGAVGQKTVSLNLTTGGSVRIALDPKLFSAAVYGSSAAEAVSLTEDTRTSLFFYGGPGDDSVTGGDGNDRLLGGTGSDSLRGGAGHDRLFANFNVVRGDGDPDWLFGASGNDSLWGSTNDTVLGGTGNDSLVASGVAELHGGAGDDWLQAFSADHTLDGGAGIDTASFGKVRTAVSVDLSDAAGSVTGIEQLIGSFRGDTFVGTGNAEVFEGGQGDDSIDGGGGRDTASYAGSRSDVTVDLRIAGAQDTRGAGVDTLVAISNLIGGAGNDALTGGVGPNALEGGAGNDVLDGRYGFDLADYTHATAGVQVSLAIAGPQDTGRAGTDTLVRMEDLRGSAFADGLAGNAGQNRLYGLAGDDIIVGGAYNDTLTGGLGADRMRGGTGFDTFDFNATGDSTRAAPDLILDFLGAGVSWGDLIDLSTIDANTTVAGNQAFSFGGRGAGGLSLVDLGSDTLVRGNTDADAAFEFAILLRDGGRHASAYAGVDFIL